MWCTNGSPAEGNGCTLCTCNPAPDGGIDAPRALPEGCADAGADPGNQSEAGGGGDARRLDADGVKCGAAVCGPGEYRCNPLTDARPAIGWACAL